MHYYILFNNYEEALAAREVLSEGNVLNRIAPLPYALLVRFLVGCHYF